MLLAHLLGVVLGGETPDLGVGEISNKRFVQLSAEVSDLALAARQNYRCLIVWNLALRLGVDTDKIKVVPYLGHQLIEIPLVLGRDRHIVRHFVE